MNIQSWMIKSWATLEWYLPPDTDKLPSFSLVGTQIRDNGATTGLCAGDTVWVAEDEAGRAGLAWEWVEVQPGIVMLADPNSIITNLQIVDSHNGLVSGLARTIAVNRLVHALPWQATVCARLPAAAEKPARAAGAMVDRRRVQNHDQHGQRRAAAPWGAPVPAFVAPQPSFPDFPALKAPGAPAPHPLQGASRRPPPDAPVRAHSRVSDHEPAFDRRLPDLRRAA